MNYKGVTLLSLLSIWGIAFSLILLPLLSHVLAKEKVLKVPIVIQEPNIIHTFKVDKGSLSLAETRGNEVLKKGGKYFLQKNKEYHVSFVEAHQKGQYVSFPSEIVKGFLKEKTDSFVESQVFLKKELEDLGFSLVMEIKKDAQAKLISSDDVQVGCNKIVSGPPPEKEKLKCNLKNFNDKKQFTVKIILNQVNVNTFLSLPPNSHPQVNPSIELTQKQAPGGSPIEIHLKNSAVKSSDTSTMTALFFDESSELPLKVSSLDVNKRENLPGLWGAASLPQANNFNSKNWWEWDRTAKVITLVTDKAGGINYKIDPIEVSHPGAGVFWSVITVVVFLILIKIVKAVPFSDKWNKDRYNRWKELNWFGKFLRFPLHFAVTPLGRYSISLTQILFWTLIVIFSFVYVAFTRGEFLTITGQMLVLLGISGGTALSAKVTAMTRVREIPDEYMKDITQDRLPRFRDLISISDIPNVFKFQIFAFTALAGAFVIRELVSTGNFPVLDENLLTLMGISGGVYIANELATENVWKKLEDLIKVANDKKQKLRDLDNEISELYAELRELRAQLDTTQSSLDKRRLSGPIHPEDPDKRHEVELQDRITKVKGKLGDGQYRETLAKELETLENQIKTTLKDVYTES